MEKEENKNDNVSNLNEGKEENIEESEEEKKQRILKKQADQQKALNKFKDIFEKLDEKAENAQMEKLQRCIIF